MMTGWATNGAIFFGILLLAGAPNGAAAHSTHHSDHPSHGSTHHGAVHAASHHVAMGHGSRRYGALRGRHGHNVRYAGISCVPFARAESGIALTGNAATWWDEAEGRYARGNAPESGSVLNFRANSSMHLGHVAVVRDVLNSREIEIDQANWWGPGGGHGVVSRNISVVDVSPHNDWTQVRVALGHSGTFGSVYPTYGFIYQRPDGADPQVMMAAATDDQIVSRHHNRHNRVRAVISPSGFDEVAEAPADAPSGPLQLDPAHQDLK